MEPAWKRIALDILKEQDACDHQKKPLKIADDKIICPKCLKVLPR